ncbi:MAG: hypothetical protein N0E44_18285 [Candidatus Thiodiazotropha lotti]|nr:hypothetical protein [Candidatus Thiodiazotropha lotti]MCW4221833.1 hypothetical protein [Candidatus Thiodiazotropha lotti]
MATIEVQEVKDVWVAWTNSDLTEGKGRQLPLAVCENEATAIRLGKGKSVQGSNCSVTKSTAVRLNGQWLGSVVIERPSEDDINQQKKIEAKRAAIEKAKSAGLTDKEIDLIKFL